MVSSGPVYICDPIEVELTNGLEAPEPPGVAFSQDARLRRLALMRKLRDNYEFRANDDDESPKRTYSSHQLSFFSVARQDQLEKIQDDIATIQYLGDVAELLTILSKCQRPSSLLHFC